MSKYTNPCDKRDFLANDEVQAYIFSLVNGMKQGNDFLTRDEMRDWIIKEEKDYGFRFEEFQRDWILDEIYPCKE